MTYVDCARVQLFELSTMPSHRLIPSVEFNFGTNGDGGVDSIAWARDLLQIIGRGPFLRRVFI